MSLTYYCMLEYDIIDMEINKCTCNMILEMNKCVLYDGIMYCIFDVVYWYMNYFLICI